MRATRQELEEQGKGDVDFWPGVFSRIAGGGTLREICEERGWAYGEVWRTITASEELRGWYEGAKKAKAEYVHDECIPLADESKDFKLRLDERRRSLKVWDRGVHGDKVDVKHGGLVPTLVIEIAALPGRIVAEQPPQVEEAEQVEEVQEEI